MWVEKQIGGNNMAGITKDPELTPKLKKLIDDTLVRLDSKYESVTLKAGFEIFRNELISRLKNEKISTFSKVRK